MVSLHPSLSPARRKIIPGLDNLMKRRKFNDDHQPRDDDDDYDRDQIIPVNDHDHHQSHPIKSLGVMKSALETELHLETPIPLEWQRCLDIRSGQVYYYNTRTNKKMFNDPSSSPEPPPQPSQPSPLPPPASQGHMSLDLELNLPCGSSDSFTKRISLSSSSSAGSTLNSLSNDHHELIMIMDSSTHSASKNNNNVGSRGGGGGGLSRAPSWLTFDGDQQEMVAAACKKCHMLVMMCKSSPSCPNCKFMHPPPTPPEQRAATATNSAAPPGLLKRRLSLLC